MAICKGQRFMTIREFSRYHLPALLYSALIVVLSSIPKLRSPDLGVEFSDKLLHACEYAIFAFLFYRSFSRARFARGGTRPLLLTLLFLVVFAAGDEYHQKFVRGRYMDGYDLLADISGGLIVVFYLKYFKKSASTAAKPDSPDTFS